MFNTVEISSYTTCDNLKSPFLGWVVLGWIVHLTMSVIATKACRILKTKSNVHYERMPFGQALKKNRRTESFGGLYDHHFRNSKLNLTKPSAPPFSQTSSRRSSFATPTSQFPSHTKTIPSCPDPPSSHQTSTANTNATLNTTAKTPTAAKKPTTAKNSDLKNVRTRSPSDQNKNPRTDIVGESDDHHFGNSKLSLTEEYPNLYQSSDIWSRSSSEFDFEISHPPINSTRSVISPDSSIGSSSHFGSLSPATQNQSKDIEANWNEPLLKNHSDFDKISRDSLGIIISHFDAKTLARSEGISRDWYKLTTQHNYWKNFTGTRTYMKKIVQKPPNQFFWRIILALILLVCLLEFTVQYGIFIVRIRENLPVGSLPEGSPCATDIVCFYPVCEDGICQEFRGEGECVMDNVNEIDPENCCSLETCQEVDNHDEPVGPSYCCRSTGTWRSYSCWTMAYIFSFNVMSIVTTTYISLKILDTHFEKQCAQIFFYSTICVLLLLTLGGHALCISTFFTHMLPGIILYIWIAISIVAPLALVMWCMHQYLRLGKDSDNHMFLLFIIFQLLELIVTPMAEYFFLGVSYTDSVATVMNEMSDMGNILEEMLIFVL